LPGLRLAPAGAGQRHCASGARLRVPNVSQIGLLLLVLAGCARDSPFTIAYPEQRHLDIRTPEQMPPAPLPPVAPPQTVSSWPSDATPEEMSLDQAIHIALGNSQVVRILTGVTATASGQTIYDAAITNTQIDVARSVFDPTLTLKNTWTRFDQPAAIFDPTSPIGVSIPHANTEQYSLSAILSKKTLIGGTFSLDTEHTETHFPPSPFSSVTGIASTSPLNPTGLTTVTMNYTQPLLRGAGLAANLAPIVVARINTEISFFQYKDSVQELVRGVVEAYWAVEFARTDVWAKKQQVEQGQGAYVRAEARKRQGFGNTAEVAQTKVALYNFKASLIGAEANLLQREAALRNILRLPPNVPPRLSLTTPPNKERMEPDWEKLLKLAGDNRPDLIDLKLTIEADQQNWIQANNLARPQLDLVSYYRWNNLEGETPGRIHVATAPGQFYDWSVGVNLSMPLGLRQDRAKLRGVELTLMRDRANLEQGMHNAIHTLAGNVRNLAQYYAQYRMYKDTRAAARENLEQQLADFRAGRAIYLNVLQAISDWGNAVSSEAASLAQYNTELANLERQTGTILETHGVHFFEDRYRAISPLGRCAPRAWYPASIPPSPNAPIYPVGNEPAERALERERPTLNAPEEPTLPQPRLLPPVAPKE
jgi:outer membrane protein TolC